MYLAMSRQAAREGYPEVAEYYKTAAFEEAEHAAKFAELLGEVVTNSTKKNLELRVAAEAGACAGKKDIATKAKQLGLDAIHDTILWQIIVPIQGGNRGNPGAPALCFSERTF